MIFNNLPKTRSVTENYDFIPIDALIQLESAQHTLVYLKENLSVNDPSLEPVFENSVKNFLQKVKDFFVNLFRKIRDFFSARISKSNESIESIKSNLKKADTIIKQGGKQPVGESSLSSLTEASIRMIPANFAIYEYDKLTLNNVNKFIAGTSAKDIHGITDKLRGMLDDIFKQFERAFSGDSHEKLTEYYSNEVEKKMKILDNIQDGFNNNHERINKEALEAFREYRQRNMTETQYVPDREFDAFLKSIGKTTDSLEKHYESVDDFHKKQISSIETSLNIFIKKYERELARRNYDVKLQPLLSKAQSISNRIITALANMNAKSVKELDRLRTQLQRMSNDMVSFAKEIREDSKVVSR